MRISELARELEPFIDRRVRAFALGSGGAGGGDTGGGALTAHALNSAYHTGQLAQSQATWAVTTTTFAAHAGDPNAHHNRDHVLATNSGLGSTHTISGATAGHVLRASSATAAAFAQLQHNDLGGVTANQHHNQTHDILGSDHTVSGGANLDVFGQSAANTIARLTPSSDVSGGSGVAAILRSTSAGLLTLKSLFVKGNVDITDGGDLWVAGSGDYAGNPVLFADSSGGNVGILTIPDPQFALDVNGPLRAQYLIGKAALQIKNVLLLCQFDGRAPFYDNQFGESNGHMGQIATTAGGLYFRQGKFSKAVVIGQGTTNSVHNPRFATNTSGWTHTQTGTGSTFTRFNVLNLADGEEAGLIGRFCAVLTPSSGGIARAVASDTPLSVPNGSSATVSCWVRKINNDLAGSIGIWNASDTTVAQFDVSTLNNSGWQFCSATWTNDTGSSVNVRFRASNSGTVNLLFTNVQLELTAFPTPYCDGTLPGHTWAGTAHASTSSRGATRLAYPTSGNINVNRSTIMGWFLVRSTNQVQTILRMDGTTAGLIILRVNASGQLQSFWGTGSGIAGGTVTAGVWHHAALTSDRGQMRLYLDGQRVAGPTTDTGFDGTPTLMDLGRSAAGGNFLNGMLDSFCIVDRILPDKEVLSIYESDAPVFAETSRYSFRATPRNLVWADDDGLWMRDAAGNAVFGIYGGDGSGYSWGGNSLDTGDLLIGRASKYVRWTSATGTLAVKGTITADDGEIAGVLTIGTSGEIRQGTGTLGSNFTGLRMWRDGSVGRIGGYNNNVLQWGAATDGKLTAGGGNVVLDENGIAIVQSGAFYDMKSAVTFLSGYGGSVIGDVAFRSSGGTMEWRAGWADTSLPLIKSLSSSANQYINLYGGTNANLRVEGSYDSAYSNITLSATSIVLNAPIRSVLSVGSTSDDIARIRPSGLNTLADTATLSLGSFCGFAFITNSTDAHGAIFYCRGGGAATVELADSNGTFSNASGTANSNNVYWDAGGSVYRIENRRGGSRSYHVILFGLSSNF